MADSQPPVPDFDGVGLAKALLRATRAGALATLDREAGFPLATLVTVATDLDGAPLLLLSRLSAHTLNLEADPRASILLSQGGKGDPLAHPRLSVIGEATRTEDPRIRTRFLTRHPKAKLYAGFADFSFWRLSPRSAHLNGGFARAMALSALQLQTQVPDPEAWTEIEPGAVAHMNADHREALALYATRLAGAAAADWQATGLDPEGIDLAAGDLTARVPFPAPLERAGALRTALKALADAARAKPGLGVGRERC